MSTERLLKLMKTVNISFVDAWWWDSSRDYEIVKDGTLSFSVFYDGKRIGGATGHSAHHTAKLIAYDHWLGDAE